LKGSSIQLSVNESFNKEIEMRQVPLPSLNVSIGSEQDNVNGDEGRKTVDVIGVERGDYDSEEDNNMVDASGIGVDHDDYNSEEVCPVT